LAPSSVSPIAKAGLSSAAEVDSLYSVDPADHTDEAVGTSDRKAATLDRAVSSGDAGTSRVSRIHTDRALVAADYEWHHLYLRWRAINEETL
jgi:hypothetical protein